MTSLSHTTHKSHLRVPQRTCSDVNYHLLMHHKDTRTPATSCLTATDECFGPMSLPLARKQARVTSCNFQKLDESAATATTKTNQRHAQLDSTTARSLAHACGIHCKRYDTPCSLQCHKLVAPCHCVEKHTDGLVSTCTRLTNTSP